MSTATAPTRRDEKGSPPTPAVRAAANRRARSRQVWILLLPALIPVAAFSVWPLLQGVYLGFTDAQAGSAEPIRFTGIDNYVRLASNDLFWASFRIGVVWAVSVTALQFLAGLGLALLLDLDLRFRWLARTLALVPWAMPPVIVAIMWRFVLDPNYGPINQSLRAIGVANPPNWLGEFSTALPAVIVVAVWAGLPQTTITLLAGLQAVDPALHEAAAIDGAGSWQRFRHVTLPALRPVIIAITTLDLIWNVNSFGLVYVLTQGGPGGQTLLPMLFAYNEAFRYGNFGYASAMGNVLVVVVVAVLLIYVRSRLKQEG